MKAAANESFGYNEDEIVSSDIVGMRFGSLFDATQTMVNQVSDDPVSYTHINGRNCDSNEIRRTVSDSNRKSCTGCQMCIRDSCSTLLRWDDLAVLP